MELSAYRRLATIVGIVVLVGGLALASGIATPRAAADMAISGTIEESRALSPEVFVGRVIGQDGGVDIGDGSSFVIPVYDVDVETSLKGEARDRVRLAVMPVDGSPEEYEGSAVTEGGRFLFAAEGPDEGLLWIDEGVDSLAITNDEEEAAVVARYRFLIAQLPPAADPEAEPCYWLGEGPILALDPEAARAGQSIRVSSSDVSGSLVYVYWDGLDRRMGQAEVDADCTAITQFTVPDDAGPGEHWVMIIDGGGWQYEESIRVID